MLLRFFLTVSFLLVLTANGVAQDKPDISASNKEAIELSQQGELEKAIFVWLQLLKITPGSYKHRWIFHKNVGRNYQKLAMLPEAWWHLERSLKLRGVPDKKAFQWRNVVETALARKHARIRVYVQGKNGEVKVGEGKHARWVKTPFHWWFPLGPQTVRIRAEGVAAVPVEFKVASELEVLELSPPTHGMVVLDILPAAAILTVDKTPVQPGTTELRLKAGKHEIVASAPQFTADATTFTVIAGKSQSVKLHLQKKVVIPPKPDPEPQPRSAWWKWTVLGGGIAMVLAGGVTYAVADSRLADEKKAHQDWRIIQGLTGSLSDAQSQQVASDWDARLSDRVEPLEYGSYGLWGVGSAVIVAGAVLLYPDLFGAAEEEKDRKVSLTPMLTDTAAGVMMEWTF
jgi:hypothetical protein